MPLQRNLRYVIVAIISFMTMVSQGYVKHQIEIHRFNQDPIYFKVEIASSPQKMIKGLQDIDYLPLKEGMLFIFKRPKIATFWMKDVRIPIDMIFITKDNVIQQIVTREDIGSLEKTQSTQRVSYVLEVNGGLSKQLGIEVGNKVKI
ncbi:MAG: hypothetical protein CMF41_02765 [Legionellales bacterium]|nr:hypothetical protein [Legionellales bacterium]OUX65428.1 MAG: hypothetical protein CBE41_01560 [Gammaproteobacteria bacterium TMED281]